MKEELIAIRKALVSLVDMIRKDPPRNARSWIMYDLVSELHESEKSKRAMESDSTERAISPEEKAEAERIIEIGKQYYEKPSKATLILNVLDRSGSPFSYSTEAKTISVVNGDVSSAVNSYRKENKCAFKFIHYDGMLFECTTKSTLTEVGTGIEI